MRRAAKQGYVVATFAQELRKCTSCMLFLLQRNALRVPLSFLETTQLCLGSFSLTNAFGVRKVQFSTVICRALRHDKQSTRTLPTCSEAPAGAALGLAFGFATALPYLGGSN